MLAERHYPVPRVLNLALHALSFTQYLLSAYCVPSALTCAGPGCITVRNSDNFFAPKEIMFWKKQTINKLISDCVKRFDKYNWPMV